MHLLVVVGLALGGLWLMFRSARRFAAEQRRLGRWDAKGPLVETAPPPHSMNGGGMNERLEVSGQWHGAILRDRRPNSTPTADGQPAVPDEPHIGNRVFRQHG
jgi:hypothetical protein